MVVQYTTIESMIGQKLGWFIATKSRFAKLLWFTLIGISNKYNLTVLACISSSFSTVIHLMYQINYNCFNEPFAVLLCSYLYLDMHGLVFETSIWLLAESTRYYMGTQYHIVELQEQTVTHEQDHSAWQNNPFYRLECILYCNQLVNVEWRPLWNASRGSSNDGHLVANSP